jgi:hypothetical protein
MNREKLQGKIDPLKERLDIANVLFSLVSILRIGIIFLHYIFISKMRNSPFAVLFTFCNIH